MQLAEDLTKEYIFDYDEWSEKTAYKAARRNAIIGVSEGLEELGLETQTAYTLGNAIGTDVNNMISGTSSALTNPFQNTFGAGVNYGISELGDSMGLNDFEMTGISIASEGLFNGATGNNNFMTDFSSTINNRVSNVLSGMTQTAINSFSTGGEFNLDLGQLALSSYSNSIGSQISQNIGLMLNRQEFNLQEPLLGESYFIEGNVLAPESQLDEFKSVLNYKLVQDGGGLFANGLMPVASLDGLAFEGFTLSNDGYLSDRVDYSNLLFDPNANYLTQTLTGNNFSGQVLNNFTNLPSFINSVNNPQENYIWDVSKNVGLVIFNTATFGEFATAKVVLGMKKSGYLYNTLGNLAKFENRLSVLNNIQKAGIYFDTWNKVTPYIETGVDLFIVMLDKFRDE